MKSSNEAMMEWSTYVARSAHRPILADLAVTFAVLLTFASERAASRKALKSLPDYLLEDVGITRKQAMTEANKPFWKR